MSETVCQPGTITRQHSSKAYGMHMTNKGCPQCVKHQRRLVVLRLWSECGHGCQPLDAAHMVRIGQATTAAIVYPYAKIIRVGFPADVHAHKLLG